MKKFTVLIIDNSEENSISLQEILVANDFEVKIALTGQAGIQLLMKELVDLVFISAEMPGIDGLTTCITIKSNPDFNGIPVIFIMEPGDLSVIKSIYETGSDDYILKPLVLSELLMKARIHIELKYSRKMAKNMNQMLEAKVAQRTFELEDSMQKLVQAKKELEILAIAKSEFLNLISHEIRTPLNGILGSLALIGRYNFSDEVTRYFSLLDTSVRRLEKFSYTILEASTLRIKGEKALLFVETDLLKVIKEAISECSEKFAEKGIQVNLQDKIAKPRIKVDPKYLLKGFVAVLDNAFKFSPDGEEIEIKVIEQSDDFLKITVADHGNGFSSGALNNIYDPLSNLEAHFDQNTGMGLHLAKLIVDAHSGFINVGNRKPAGAIVEILIPVRH